MFVYAYLSGRVCWRNFGLKIKMAAVPYSFLRCLTSKWGWFFPQCSKRQKNHILLFCFWHFLRYYVIFIPPHHLKLLFASKKMPSSLVKPSHDDAVVSAVWQPPLCLPKLAQHFARKKPSFAGTLPSSPRGPKTGQETVKMKLGQATCRWK